jgi:hypothetical protein
VVQFYPHALHLTPAQREGGVPDAHHERIAARTRLGQDLDVLAVHETELEQPPLERRERSAA